MKASRDLAITLIMSAILILSVSYLTQCSSPPQRPSPTSSVETDHEGEASSGKTEREEAAGKPNSARDLEEEGDQEERAKIQRVGRALQTIGANPELTKTLGIPP
ncbi:MAG TPA: hypothetical protein VMW56_13695 [Candidatus Margulisiibacteriota bacterium]|nr:hypothetical protein [Candidatus Margulisiibacteriota bacterium]